MNNKMVKDTDENAEPLNDEINATINRIKAGELNQAEAGLELLSLLTGKAAHLQSMAGAIRMEIDTGKVEVGTDEWFSKLLEYTSMTAQASAITEVVELLSMFSSASERRIIC